MEEWKNKERGGRGERRKREGEREVPTELGALKFIITR
jgi:hypothetical protein